MTMSTSPRQYAGDGDHPISGFVRVEPQVIEPIITAEEEQRLLELARRRRWAQPLPLWQGVLGVFAALTVAAVLVWWAGKEQRDVVRAHQAYTQMVKACYSGSRSLHAQRALQFEDATAALPEGDRLYFDALRRNHKLLGARCW
jgi:hypothetical protein